MRRYLLAVALGVLLGLATAWAETTWRRWEYVRSPCKEVRDGEWLESP